MILLHCHPLLSEVIGFCNRCSFGVLIPPSEPGACFECGQVIVPDKSQRLGGFLFFEMVRPDVFSCFPFVGGFFCFFSMGNEFSTAFLFHSSYLVGRECAGKTTLCEKNLLAFQQIWDDPPEESKDIDWEERTRGVSMHCSVPNYWGSANLELVFLDFGGHAIYHMAHEFFLCEQNAMTIVLLTPFEAIPNGEALFALLCFCPKPVLFPLQMLWWSCCWTDLGVTCGVRLVEFPYKFMEEELYHWLTMIVARCKVMLYCPFLLKPHRLCSAYLLIACRWKSLIRKIDYPRSPVCTLLCALVERTSSRTTRISSLSCSVVCKSHSPLCTCITRFNMMVKMILTTLLK